MTRVSSRVADNPEVNEEIGVGRYQPVLFVVLRPPASHIQSQQLDRNKGPNLLSRASDCESPYRSSHSARCSLPPIGSCREGSRHEKREPELHSDRARQFREHGVVSLDAMAIGCAAAFSFIGPQEILATALGNFDDRVLVLP